MKKYMILILVSLTLAIMAGYSIKADAKFTYWDQFNLNYGTGGVPDYDSAGSLGNCLTCHTSGSTRNSYGADFRSNNHDFSLIEFLDSDGDGADNITEIQAGTFPGDSTSTPVVTAQPPVADAGPDQIANSGVSVTLNGSNSTDPDNDIASYFWEQTAGTSVTLAGAATAQSTFIAPDVVPAGEALSFRLTVTDSGERVSTDISIVNVSWANLAPIADAGPDQSVNEGDPVSLSGVNSSDPDDGIAAYLWEQTGGTLVNIANSTASQAGFTAPASGLNGVSLTFNLKVTDAGGLQSTDTVIINVVFISAPPVADAGPNQTVNEGVVVTLDGSNSSDPDNGLDSFLWTQTGGAAVTLSNASLAQPAFTAPNVGPAGSSLTFELTVTDAGGLQAAAGTIVNVTWINEAPTANAGPGQNAGEGVLVVLDGTNSNDPDDGIASYLWAQTAGEQVTLSDPTASRPSFTTPIPGPSGAMSLTFRLTVTDAGGLQSSDTTVVNVSSVINEPPIAVAGPDQTVIEGDTVTLNGLQSRDPDDGLAMYLWTQTAGASVTLSDPTASQPTFLTPPVSRGGSLNLTFRLTVTDNSGLQASADVSVKIDDNGLSLFPEDVLTARASTSMHFGVKAGAGGNLTRLTSIDVNNITGADMPADLPYGLIEMVIKVDSPGQTVEVTIYLQEAAPEDYSWVKFSVSQGWRDFGANAVFSADRKSVVLTLTDGGQGDEDGLANGVILDPSGLGSNGGLSDSSAGGFCFISTLLGR